MNTKDQLNQYIIAKLESQLIPLSGENKSPFTQPDTLDWLQTPDTLELPYEVTYQTNIGQNSIDPLGKSCILTHTQAYHCPGCSKQVKSLLSGGFCYPCSRNKACADWCVMNPYQCHFTKGTCREPQWGLSFCYQPHYLYLSYTDKFKIGITRQPQLFTRWADQGATMATVLCLAPSRHQAGVLEKALTSILADKTHWQRMLKAGNTRIETDVFLQKRNEALTWLHEALRDQPQLQVPHPTSSPVLQPVLYFPEAPCVHLYFPVPVKLPETIKSLSLSKLNAVSGTVLGIKGQYLFLEEGVFNVRQHEGFIIQGGFS